jgi:ABC-2 type transport system permease protein
VFGKSLADQRWQIVGFGAALFAIAVLDVFLWPSYKESFAQIELPPAFAAILGDLSLTTGAGFLNAEYFSWIHALLIVHAVIQGTGAIAGEESAGTIDLLLAQPISRARVVIEKSAAAITGSAAIVAAAALGFIVSVPFVDIDVSVLDTTIATANMLPITLFFYSVALWAGAVAPNRTVAVAFAIAVATSSYVAYTVASGIDDFSWVKYATPFYYYGGGLPLVRGIEWQHVSLLLGVAALFVTGAVRTIDARDMIAGGGHGLRPGDLANRIVGRRV